MNRFIFNIVSHTFLCMFASLHTEASDIILVEDGKSLQQIVMPSDRTSSQSEKSLLLAEGGKAFQKIVISANASNDIKTTAAYLAEKLEKISGAKFEIETGDGCNGIVLGTMADFPVEALKRPLEIRPVLKDVDIRNGLEAYGIRTEEKRLLLLGGGEPGVSHAVARFLELLGYRRFYPGLEWEIIPSIPKLSFDLNETDRPAILSRNMWHAFGLPNEPSIVEGTPEGRAIRAKTDITSWFRQNRLGFTFLVYAAHNYGLPKEKADFNTHPEYYSLIDGKRVPRTICVSNPAVRAMKIELALEYFEKNLDRNMYSMERGDGDVMCECESCKALGDDSARTFGLANEAAKAVRHKYPGKMIGVLAYNMHDLPPSFEMEPNVHVQVARLFIRSKKTFRQLVDMWSRKTPNIGVYDYFSTYQWGQDRLREKAVAGPTANLALFCDDIRFLTAKGILSLWSETSVAWGAHGRGNLVATRLMWNPDADVNAILSDFYEKAFGPAAPAMKRYFERVDGQNEFVSKTFFGLAFRDVDEAAKLAKDRPDIQARLDHIKQFLYFNELNYRLFTSKDELEKKDLTLKLLTHQFRTRYSYMTHWHAVSNYLSDFAKKYSEPSWALPNGKEVAKAKKEKGELPVPPWLTGKACAPDFSLPGYAYVRAKDMIAPYSHDETEKLFQSGLSYFQPQFFLNTIQYSNDLVPVIIEGANSATASRQVQIPGGHVYLYSLTGEPLQVDIRGNKNINLSYVLRDNTGKLVVEGQLPKDEDYHALKLPVPMPGLYRFECKGGNMNSAVEPGKANTFSLLEDRGMMRYTMNGLGGRNFFYVPKGTREFQFYWAGDVHKLYDPSGKVLLKIEISQDYQTVAVPEGMDGKVWSFDGRWNTRKFINIPNYIAPSPDALLIPRELAEKDGLTILKGKK